jgi:hypothetical protein
MMRGVVGPPKQGEARSVVDGDYCTPPVYTQRRVEVSTRTYWNRLAEDEHVRQRAVKPAKLQRLLSVV